MSLIDDTVVFFSHTAAMKCVTKENSFAVFVVAAIAPFVAAVVVVPAAAVDAPTAVFVVVVAPATATVAAAAAVASWAALEVLQ